MENLLLPTKIIKSKRKSISLTIKNNGDLIVRIPLYLKEKDATNFINQKASWIIKKRSEIMNNQIKPMTLSGDEKIQILGKSYEIIISDTKFVKIVDNKIIVPKENSKEKLINYLKKCLKTYLTEKIEYYCKSYGFKYTKLSTSSAKTCWGSCSFKNNLHFTYKLVLCPIEVIDYVILHELVHTKVKNHSKLFWSTLQSVNPKYKTQELWLKKNGALIDLI